MARQHFELLHRAFLGNDGVQANRAGDASLARERRIDWVNSVDERSSRYRATLANAALHWLRRRRTTARAANHAAENAGHATAGDAARNAALHAHCVGVGLSFFLNNLRFPRDDLWLDQLIVLHQVHLRLDLHDLRWGRRRRRWRRGRRHKHRGQHTLRQCFRVNQRNQNKDCQETDLQEHGNDNGPRLVGLPGRRARYHHFFKHDPYLLPTGASRPAALSLTRVFVPAAVRCLLPRSYLASDARRQREAQQYQNWSTFLPQSP